MAEENEVFIEDEVITLEDSEESVIDDADVSAIIPFIMERYKRADDYRQQDETRWLRSYRNYRGIYGSDVQFTEAEKSRVFIKVTKTLILANQSNLKEETEQKKQVHMVLLEMDKIYQQEQQKKH